MAPIDDLRGLSISLNKASDELNNILKTTEDELRELNLGVEAWVDYPITESSSWSGPNGIHCVETLYLGWTKLEGKWSLAVKTTLKKSGFSDEYKSTHSHGIHIYSAERELIRKAYTHEGVQRIDSLLSKSREIRAIAIRQLESLFNELYKEAGSILDAIDTAKDIISKKGKK